MSNENENHSESPSSNSESVDDSSSNELDEEPPKIYTKDYDLHQRPFPTTERIMKDVEKPVTQFIKDEDFWDSEFVPRVEVIRDHVKREGRLSKTQIKWIIENTTDVFAQEDNILIVPSPVVVCGDIHGQFYDLLKLLELGGDPATTRYLFLGDYVDRGNFSVECIILLYCYKILYPDTFFMIRGNHECRHLTDYFTFKEECIYKYDEEIYDLCMESFDALPLAAVMNKQFLCIHGGLSPDLKTLDDINNINRFCEPPPSGIYCDILWSDPMEEFEPEILDEFVFNKVRGCSYWFSYNAVCKFLDDNNLLSIIRAHEVQDPGYRMHKKNEKTGFPSLITLFSAPKYCDQYDNKGAIMKYENNVINIRQFNHSDHPYYLPGFVNVFAWSIPFVSDKVSDILFSIENLVDDAEAEEVEKYHVEQKKNRIEIVRAKVKTVSKMLKLYQELKRMKNTQPVVDNSLHVSEPNTSTTDQPNESRPPNVDNYADKVMKSRRTLRRTMSMDLRLLQQEGMMPPKPTIGEITEDTTTTT